MGLLSGVIGKDLFGYVQDPASMTNNWFFSCDLMNDSVDDEGVFSFNVDAERVQVTVSVSAVSYALHYTSFPRSLNVSLDGQYVTLDPASITYDGKEQAVSPLGTTNFTVELPANSSKAMTLQVEWQFNGEMGGPNGRMVLPTIECGGIINVTR